MSSVTAYQGAGTLYTKAHVSVWYGIGRSNKLVPLTAYDHLEHSAIFSLRHSLLHTATMRGNFAQ